MQDCKVALFVLGLYGMRNLIIGISTVFVAIIAVSYFYFSNLGEKRAEQPPLTPATVESVAETTPPPVSDSTLWTFDLNGGAINRPSVYQFGDSSRFILVQDAYHILHAISPDGQKLWNAQLPGPILDSIAQLTDHSLVFTTAERLYRIDTDGNPLPGFSLTLPQQATQGAAATGGQAGDDGVHIEVRTARHVLSYNGRGKLLRRQTSGRNSSTHGADHADGEPVSANLPHGCGPFAYAGPLQNDGQRYLLCSKEDRKLYCFRY